MNDQQVPVEQRAEAAETMYYEAYCRNKDPVYGCVGIISQLHEQIDSAQSELAKIRAKISVISSKTSTESEYHQVCTGTTTSAGFGGAAATTSLEGNAAPDPNLIEFDPSFTQLNN